MIRIERFLAAALVAASFGAQAQDQRYDPKALARYDVSYVRCEAKLPEMKNHRDEAYLSLWRATPSPKSAAKLAEVRASAPYKAEHAVASRHAAGASEPEAAKALERQCRGLWGEMKRMPKPAQ
jgi:hypothetical protein